MTDAFHIVEELRLAQSNRERAAWLLRVPDGIVQSHGVQLQAECALQFEAGVAFLNLRGSAINSVRDAHGLLPDWIGKELELWRFTLSRFAAGQGGELPSFMRGPDATQT